MSTSNTTTKGQTRPSQRRYPVELRERAVRMVCEATAEGGESFGVVTRVARQLEIGPESLRNWVKQAEVDSGQRPDVTTEERRRIAATARTGAAHCPDGRRPPSRRRRVRSTAA